MAERKKHVNLTQSGKENAEATNSPGTPLKDAFAVETAVTASRQELLTGNQNKNLIQCSCCSRCCPAYFL